MKLWRHRRPQAPQVDEARRARQLAEIELERTRAETPIYRALGDSLRELREHNHFAQAIKATLGGKA